MLLSKNICISDINHQHYFWSQISVYEEKTQKNIRQNPSSKANQIPKLFILETSPASFLGCFFNHQITSSK